MLFPLISISALVDSINPCAISVLLLTVAFLFSLNRTRSDILKTGAAYILGIYIIYLLIGLGLLRALSFFGIPHFMARIGASIIILFGAINIINEYFPSFPIKLKIPSFAHDQLARVMERGSTAAMFFLGALVGFYEFPCTGGPYLLVLGLLHDQATYLKGLLYLVYYNLIFVLPLVIILVISSRPGVLARVQAWRKEKTGKVRYLEGLLMIGLGLIIFFTS